MAAHSAGHAHKDVFLFYGQRACVRTVCERRRTRFLRRLGEDVDMASAVRRRCLDDSVTKCDSRCLEAGMHLQFREDVLDVGADRMPTDRETGRDLVARSPSRQQREDLAFTPSQYLDRSSLAARRARIGLYERLRSYELPIDDTLDGSDEGGPREGLHDVAHKPQLERSCDDSRILVGCQGDDFGAGLCFQNLRTELEAAPIGKAQVHEHHLRSVQLHGLERLRCCLRRRDDRHPDPLERETDGVGEEPVIINDQDVDGEGLLVTVAPACRTLPRARTIPT